MRGSKAGGGGRKHYTERDNECEKENYFDNEDVRVLQPKRADIADKC